MKKGQQIWVYLTPPQPPLFVATYQNLRCVNISSTYARALVRPSVSDTFRFPLCWCLWTLTERPWNAKYFLKGHDQELEGALASLMPRLGRVFHSSSPLMLLGTMDHDMLYIFSERYFITAFSNKTHMLLHFIRKVFVILLGKICCFILTRMVFFAFFSKSYQKVISSG